MAQSWTIQKLIEWMMVYFEQKGIDSSRLTAELLLSYVLGVKRIELYMKFNEAVEQQHLDQLRGLVKRIGENEPYAYLIGKTEFYSMEIKVTPDCLIPRPETELLVERAIELLRAAKANRTQKLCDLCTGSGCIAVAIAKNYQNCKIIATDISDAALAVAAENVGKYNLSDRIELLCGDLFEPIIHGLDDDKFDMIVSNPPYVSDAEFELLDENVKDYEPRQALYGGKDGLDIYRKIIGGLGDHLKPDGVLIMEIGYSQGQAVKQLLEPVFSEVKIEKDISNNDRIVIASNVEKTA